MTSTIGIGVPIPKMLREQFPPLRIDQSTHPSYLAITGTWTAPFAAYLLLLSNRVVYHRLKHEKYLGDRAQPSTSSDEQSNPDELFLATRAHGNFLENVPLAFVLATVAELNGANRKALNYAMAALFVMRIAHVELGMRGEKTVALGRPIAYYGTQGFLAGLAAYSAYLVKGYWGF
ncbi:hypothetical protein MMC20_003864 [Loxospora ochrophaea]|nr:hypothetical protein [Loxospora ochrophaea]